MELKPLFGLFVVLAVLGSLVWLLIRVRKGQRKRTVLSKYAVNRAPESARPHLPTASMPSTVRFKYKDANGAETERTVRLSGVDADGMFSGYCELRKENRSFYIQRIIGHTMTDTKTGEILDARKLVPALDDAPVALDERTPPNPFYLLCIVFGILAIFLGGMVKLLLCVATIACGVVALSQGEKNKVVIGLMMAGSGFSLIALGGL